MDAFHPHDRIPRASACSRPDLGLLLRASVDLPLDGGPHLAAHARACPACGPRWRLLRRAQAWLSSPAAVASLRAPLHAQEVAGLEALAPRTAEGDACPAAEDLFEVGTERFGEALERLGAVREHVAHCASCSALVDTLSTPPPLPFEVPHEAETPREAAARSDPAEPAAARAPSSGEGTPALARANVAAETTTRPHPLRLLDDAHAATRPQLASTAATRDRRGSVGRFALVAAVLIATVAIGSRLIDGPSSTGTPLRGLPDVANLRGSLESPLLLPREKLLRGAQGLLHPFVFEIEPQADASGYRVKLLRHSNAQGIGGVEDSSAFGAGSEVLRLTSDTPRRAGVDLPAGRYTWEAWARIGGLEVALGRRDFEVVQDDALAQEFDGLADAPEGRRRDALSQLWERGFRAHAVRLARELPPSQDRDTFLERALAR